MLSPGVVHVFSAWGVALVLWTCFYLKGSRCALIASFLLAVSTLHAFYHHGGAWDFAFHLGTYGLALLVPSLFKRAQQSLAQDFSRRQAGMQEQRDRAAKDHENALREKIERQEHLERLQNRFALVQVMATKLEAGEILQTLGHMWRKRPGVKGCLILRRQLNGSWGTSFTDGYFNVQDWLRVLGSHPALGRSRNIRRYAPPSKQLTLPGQPFAAVCLLVPFTWDKDNLAMGVLEVDPSRVDESMEGFNTERKIVSIGLKRADLYDLMTERSRFDGLTGAFLRRPLMERLEEGLRKSHRYNTPLFFALMDIDHFKGLNDRWGHVVGDKALVSLAGTVRKLSLPGITLGRFGGDEFALIFEMESINEVMTWFGRLRQVVAETPVRDREAVVRFTISAGVSAFLPERPPVSELMAQADHALYQAKNAGRDRVVLWHTPTSRPAQGTKR